MSFHILFIGRFRAEWFGAFSSFGIVLRAISDEEALDHLRRQDCDVVLLKGECARLGEIMDLAPHLIQLRQDESEQSLFLRSILDNLPHMVFVKDAKDLRFVRWNKAGEDLIGMSCEEMVGKTDFDLFPEKEASFFQKMDREVLQRRVLHDIAEETIQTQGHGVRVLHTKKIPICNEAGEPIYLLGISEDITELKEMKAQAAARLEAAREAERRHIARELHDELGQLLTALKLDLGRLEGQIRPELRQQTDAMSELLDHTISTVRRLATELRPQILDDLGLKAGLEWLVKQLCERKGIVYSLKCGLADSQVNDLARSAFFRICQEALNNVVRHSQAQKVQVELWRDSRGLVLSVQDDGIGFDPVQSSTDSLGLLGVQERINSLGGRFQIDSKLGVGTELTVSAPLDRCLSTDENF